MKKYFIHVLAAALLFPAAYSQTATQPDAAAKPKAVVKKVRKLKPLPSTGQESVAPLAVPVQAASAQKPAAAAPIIKEKPEPVLVPTAKKERERTKPVIEETVLPPYMPIAERLGNQLSVPLHFSVNQQRRVVKTLKYDIDEPIRKMFEEYENTREKARRSRFALNDLTQEMFLMKAQIYEDIRPILDELQKERLDHLIYNGYFSMYNGANKGVYISTPTAPAEPSALPESGPQENEMPRQTEIPASAYPQ